MRYRLALTLVIAVTAIAVMAAPARADDPKAKALFDEGLNDMLEERYETGCEALRQSCEIEPLIGAVFTVGECYFRWERYAAAQEYLERFKTDFEALHPTEKIEQQHRMDVAAKRLSELPDLVPLLTLNLPSDAPAGTKVLYEGEALPADSLGIPKAFEVGKHQFTVRMPSGAEVERGLLLQPGDRRTVTLDLPGKEQRVPRAVTPTEATDGSAVAEEPDGAPLLTGDQMRLIAYIGGGVGAASVIVSFVTGGLVFSEKADLSDNCVDRRCNDEGAAAADSAQSLALVSTVTAIGGAVLLGGATALWFLAPDDEPPARSANVSLGAVASPISAAAVLKGQF